MKHKTEGLARPCTAWDLFLSGPGLQCGNCLATDHEEIERQQEIRTHPFRPAWGNRHYCQDCGEQRDHPKHTA